MAVKDVEERVQQFLVAPQFQSAVPRRFPRARLAAAKAWSRVAGRAGDALFERGIDTSGQEITVEHYHPDRVWYQASGWTFLRRILPKREVDARDVFVDFGSGKGRVLLQAARYPFARVIGVEISEELNEVAQVNIDRQRHGFACGDVELVTADASTWRVPDDVTVAYFFYPFVGSTFQKVIANLLSSLERNPRRMRLIYLLPEMEDEILSTGAFRLVRSIRIVSRGLSHRLSLYETK